MDEHGIKSERIRRLKNSQSGFKGVVSKKCVELLTLMKDTGNAEQVRKKMLELESSLRDFNFAHNKYHAELMNEADILDSNEYFASVQRMVSETIGEMDQWLQSAQSRIENELAVSISLRPDDSISNGEAGSPRKVNKSKSATSSSSLRASSAVSTRLKISARKAALAAEVSKLQERQAIQNEELLLQQKKGKLRIETELAKAVAEESVYFKRERSSSLPLPRQLPTSTPQETKVVIDSPTVPSAETNLSSLNPEAPEWQGSKSVPLSEREANISETLIKHHLSVSDKNASEMLDIQKLQQQQNKEIQELLKQQQQQTLALTLPQPEVPVFSADPTEYSDFIRAFENLIESKTSDPSMKLYYLVQYTAGDVRQLMRGCLPMKPEEGNKTARSLHKNRFGQGYKIATAYMLNVLPRFSL